MGIEIGEDGTGFVSRDAQHSTYAPATPTPEEEAYPPSGPGTEQTLNKPAEAPAGRASKPAAKAE